MALVPERVVVVHIYRVYLLATALARRGDIPFFPRPRAAPQGCSGGTSPVLLASYWQP